jgi:hypothetical protein
MRVSARNAAAIIRGILSNHTDRSRGGPVEETMKEWVLYVMTWAAQLSGYPFPDSLPEVQWKSEGWFSHRACKDHIPCPIYGL